MKCGCVHEFLDYVCIGTAICTASPTFHFAHPLARHIKRSERISLRRLRLMQVHQTTAKPLQPNGDIVSPEQRSKIMRAVRQQRTSPERAVAKVIRELGYSYRLNRKTLPGSPDLSNARQGWAIFVHGCFWHGHRHCKKTKGGAHGRVPATRSAFWQAKIEANRERDLRKHKELARHGLRVLTVWECELREPARLRRRLRRFLFE